MAYSLITEVFSEYGIGVFVLLLRLFARWRVVGFENASWDDLFTVTAIIFWTIQTTFIYLMSNVYGTNIGLTAETAAELPDSVVADRIIGSKLAFSNWIWYLCLMWSLKGILLVLFNKLTLGLWQHKLAMAMRFVCVATWLACILTHVCLCTPIYKSWQVKPYPGDNCTIRKPNYIVIAILNICTDLGILIIPLPLLFAAKIKLCRKIILTVLFSSGIFVMIAVILRAYYSMRDIRYLATALGWASREVFVAAFTASLPGIKPLMSSSRWVNSYSSSKNNYNNNTKTSRGKSDTAVSGRSQSVFAAWAGSKAANGNFVNIGGECYANGQQIELTAVARSKKNQCADEDPAHNHHHHHHYIHHHRFSVDSQEHIIRADETSGKSIFSSNDDPNIHVTTAVTVSAEELSDGSPESLMEKQKRDFVARGHASAEC